MSEKMIENFSKYASLSRPLLFALVLGLHVAVICIFNFKQKSESVETVDFREAEVFKLVDIQEYVKPAPKPVEKKDVVKVSNQPKASETVIETEDKVENEASAPQEEQIEYLPQHKISSIPVIPGREVLSRIVYPPMALKQGIEAVVYLELFIDSKMGKGGIRSRYCDDSAAPYYVLLSPDYHVIWKSAGYGPGIFLGLAAAINGPQQDNSRNLPLAIRKVETTPDGTVVSFRFYGQKNSWFRVASGSCLTANGKQYKVVATDGITLGKETYPSAKASTATEGVMASIYYSDFTLTFEPFETLPASFDFKEGDGDRDFMISNIRVNN